MKFTRFSIFCLFMSAVAEVRVKLNDDIAPNVLQVRALKKSSKAPKGSKAPTTESAKNTKAPKNPKIPKAMATKQAKSVKKQKSSKNLKEAKSKKTKGPTNSPTLPPVVAFVPTLQSGSVPVTVIITTDDYPQETSYQVQKVGGQIFMAGGAYTGQRTTYSDTKNLPSGVFAFIISDSFGDGMCCAHGNGGYNLFVNGALVKAGGSFATTETVTFSTGNSPTLAPISPPVTNKPINKPTNAPTNSPTNPPATCGTVTVVITTDDYPAETFYQVKTLSGAQVMSGDSYTGKRQTYTDSSCLSFATYEFTIGDTKGDGMCCAYGNGGYNLFVDNVLVSSGGPFTFSQTMLFSSQNSPVTPPTNSPTLAPTNPRVTSKPTNNPTNAPTNSPTNPPATCGTVTVVITTDDYPAETFYQVKTISGAQVMSGDSYTGKRQTYTDSSCLSFATYEFTIGDTKGDGMCCAYGNGGYNLFVDNVLVSSGGQFTFSQTMLFSSQNSPVTPPTNSPTLPAPFATPKPTPTPPAPLATPKPIPTSPVVTPKPVPTSSVPVVTPKPV